MSFAGYFLSVLFCLLSMLISDSRFDLVWFRLSCDHGWIRSGSVNVRKQQQQQQRCSDLAYHEKAVYNGDLSCSSCCTSDEAALRGRTQELVDLVRMRALLT